MMLIKRVALVGIILELIIVTAYLYARAAETAPPIVRIAASKFRFTPDHITLTKGQPVIVQLASADVIHGFMIRALHIDTDVKPGTVTQMRVTPEEAGTFKAICDHYCGLGHGGMKMIVVVKEK